VEGDRSSAESSSSSSGYAATASVAGVDRRGKSRDPRGPDRRVGDPRAVRSIRVLIGVHGPSSANAYSECSEAPINNAAQPETARAHLRHESADMMVTDPGNGSYTVASLVDQHTLAGVERHHYNCEVDYSLDGTLQVGWHIIDLRVPWVGAGQRSARRARRLSCSFVVRAGSGRRRSVRDRWIRCTTRRS
jgi:hypothetical protein